MVEFDIEALCNERSVTGLPVTRKLLAQEAEYYNLQSLMDSIGSPAADSTPLSPVVRGELYLLFKSIDRVASCKYELFGPTEILTHPQLQGLRACSPLFLEYIQEILTRRNMSGLNEGCRWTLWVATYLAGDKMEIVIRGDRP